MFKKPAALFVLEFAGRPFPLDQFADGFRQFGETEAEKLRTVSRMSASSAGSKVRPEKESSCSGMAGLLSLLVFLPIRKERQCPAKYLMKRRNFMGGVPQRSWMIRLQGSIEEILPAACQPGKQRKSRLGGKKQRIRGVPALEKPTNEWVERQFEAARFYSKWNKRSS
jgi:hypothetical protein